MLVRSRSARFAALALVAATPLVASYAAPAFADGSDAEVGVEFDDDGDVHVSSSKGLSRVTVVLCDGSVVVADSWGGAMTGEVDVDGDVRAVFIHSGNNTTEEAQDRLDELAPGAVNGGSTGEIAFDESCDEDPGDDGTDDDDDSDDDDSDDDDSGDDGSDDGSDDDGSDDADDDTTVTPTDISDPAPKKDDPAPAVTTNPAPETTVLGVTIEKASNPAPAPATSPVVDSNTLSAGGELPRTGASVQFLMTLALSLIAAGAALRAAFGRRIRSASSPG